MQPPHKQKRPVENNPTGLTHALSQTPPIGMKTDGGAPKSTQSRPGDGLPQDRIAGSQLTSFLSGTQTTVAKARDARHHRVAKKGVECHILRTTSWSLTVKGDTPNVAAGTPGVAEVAADGGLDQGKLVADTVRIWSFRSVLQGLRHGTLATIGWRKKASSATTVLRTTSWSHTVKGDTPNVAAGTPGVAEVAGSRGVVDRRQDCPNGHRLGGKPCRCGVLPAGIRQSANGIAVGGGVIRSPRSSATEIR